MSEIFSLVGELRKYLKKQDAIQFVRQTTSTIKDIREAKTPEDKHKAAQAISDMIKKL